MSPSLAAWAGLGLLFVGVHLIGLHVQPMVGGSLSRLISKSLRQPLIPRAAGFVSGALTSSASAVVFVSAGLISTGAATLGQALPLLAWANVGTSSLVLLAAVDLGSLALVMLGAIGMACMASADRRDTARHGLMAALGVALLMLGLSLIKTAAASLRGDPLAEEFLAFAASGVAVGYLVGFVLAAVLQSSSIVTVMMLPLLQSGVTTFADTAALIYGACLGSGISVVLLASGGSGPARQLALCQGGMRLMGSVLLMTALLVERHAGVPLVLAAVEQVADSDALRAGLLFLVFQSVVVIASWPLSRTLADLAVRLSPPALAEDARRPQYLFDEGSQDGETALTLAALETGRLAAALPTYLDALRADETGHEAELSLNERQAASTALAAAIEEFLGATLDANPDMVEVERVFRLRTLVSAIRSVQVSVHDFARGITDVPEARRPPVSASMIEALHFILITAAAAVEGSDEEEITLLAQMADERGEVMDVVRKSLLEAAVASADREALLATTFAFERALWQLRSLAGTLRG